jgi:hypothetical protein
MSLTAYLGKTWESDKFRRECYLLCIHAIESYRMPSQTSSMMSGRNWVQLLCFLNPLRGPGILVALVATGVQEVGESLPWYMLLLACLANLLLIRIVSWIIMDAVCFCLDVCLMLWKWQEVRVKERMRKKDSLIGTTPLVFYQFRGPCDTPQGINPRSFCHSSISACRRHRA